jgi:hypothetical protein
MPLADPGPWAISVNGQAPASRGRLWYLITVADTEVLRVSVVMKVYLMLLCGSEAGGLIQVEAMNWGKYWTNSSGSNALVKRCCLSETLKRWRLAG